MCAVGVKCICPVGAEAGSNCNGCVRVYDKTTCGTEGQVHTVV